MSVIVDIAKTAWIWVTWVFRIGKLAQKVESVVKRYSDVETAVEENEDKIGQMELDIRLEVDKRMDQMYKDIDRRLDSLRVDLERKDKEMYKFLAEKK